MHPPRAPRASPKVDSGESGWGIVINRLISPCALPADYCVLYPRNTLRPIKNRRSLDNQLNPVRPIRAPYPSPAGASAHSPLAQGHRPLAANMGRAGIPPWDTAFVRGAFVRGPDSVRSRRDLSCDGALRFRDRNLKILPIATTLPAPTVTSPDERVRDESYSGQV